MAHFGREVIHHMPERINKLQPDRTVALRGFDTFAAAASIHSASPTGFTVSGTFRDPADFAVAVLYDADDFYEHPLIKYLPDFNFNGLTLSFNLSYTDGLQPIDSPKYNWIDWATLDCILADGTTSQVNLFNNATLVGSSFPASTATVNVVGSSIYAYDRITLWFQNLAYDYEVPAGVLTFSFPFYAAGPGNVHSITVAGRTYSYTEPAAAADGSGVNSSQVASGVAAAVNDPYVVATSSGNIVVVTVQLSAAGTSFVVSDSDGSGSVTMLLMTPVLIAEQIVNEINGTNWVNANTTHALIATNSGAEITLTAARYGTANVSGTTVTLASGTAFPGIVPGAPIYLAGTLCTVAAVQSPTQLTLTGNAGTLTGVQYVAPRGGRDGNLIQLYTVAKTSSLTFSQSEIQLSGGSSTVTWNVSLDFTALNISQIRQMWLTFAPSLTLSPYTATEWQAVFSNWTLSGPASTQALTVSGPGSVRVEQDDRACTYTGTWITDPTAMDAGFYSKYFATATSDTTNGGAKVTLSYTCQHTHDLYIGTSLYVNRGQAGIRLDGDSETSLNCYLNTGSPVITRRIVRSNVSAGKHTVTIRLAEAGYFYFDFLEAAVVSDVPDALTPRTGISPALDFDTDHTYKLSPARLMWIMDKLGYAGPMNEYLGVFWWNERVLSGGSVSTAQITFSGTYAGGDTIFLTLNGTVLGKTVFPADTTSTMATHFANYINTAFVGAYTSASGPVLTITGRSPAPAYNLGLYLVVNSTAGAAAISTVIETIQVTLSGTFATGDTIALTVNGTTVSTTFSATDALSDLASRLSASIGASSGAGVTATASGAVITMMPISGGPALGPRASASVTPLSGVVTKGVVTISEAPATGVYGTWIVNDAANPPLNRAALDWHADFYAQCASRSRPVVTSCSMELVNPPDGYVARFPDPSRTAVSTDTGFGSLVSNHCAAGGSKMLTYQKSVYRTIAAMQAAAGLTPSLQYGEFLWWYFDGPGGMAYYDDETMAAAQAALGRPLYVFLTPNDDPTVNGSADAIFLRNRLRDHVATLVADIRSAYPNAQCEVLWPYDVNYPSPVPVGNPSVGGQLNRFINLPTEWQTQSSSGLNTMKIEALAFASTMRDLDLAREAIDLFPGFGWPVTSLRYLVPVFGAATPWGRELALALGAGIRTNNLWALDHVCLYDLQVPEPTLERRSLKVG